MRHLLWPALLALPFVAGCTPRLPDGHTGGSRAGDATSVAYVTCGGRLFAVWTDISFDDLPMSSAGVENGHERVAALASRGRGMVHLRVWTEDGRSLRVAVNGVEYPAASGTLFTVRTRGGPAEVRQLPRTLSGDPLADEELFRRMSADTPEIRDFIAVAELKD